MILLVPLFLVLLVLAFVFPKASRFFFLAPMLGSVCGAFIWTLAAIFSIEVRTTNMFTYFVVGGIVLAEIFAAFQKPVSK